LAAWFSFILSLRSSGEDRLVAEWTKTRDAETALEPQILDFDRDYIDFITAERARNDRVSLDDLLNMIIGRGGTARGVDLIQEVAEGGRGAQRLVRNRLRTLVRTRRLEEFIAPEDRRSSAKSYRVPDGAEQG
jgi:hypothetical protein